MKQNNKEGLLYYRIDEEAGQNPQALFGDLLSHLKMPFKKNGKIGLKIHWGERGNRSFLPPHYAREIVRRLREEGHEPFVFDTTVLYSGGRRDGAESLKTAAANGYSEAYLGCPVIVGDGMDGRQVLDIAAGYKHFKTVQVTSIIDQADGFVIFSHFKGHMASSFGGAIKNLSMGFASRAQKQRMHADVQPILNRKACIKCGICLEACPVKAVSMGPEDYPVFDLSSCIGCAQCIGLCPEMALKIFWGSDDRIFQEKLVETAAAVWKKIKDRTILINALIQITAECDCFPGKNPVIADDYGFMVGHHPVRLDEGAIKIIGAAPFEKTHPGVYWKRQFEYAREIEF